MKCEFCGRDLPYDTNQCPNCGAPCEKIPSPAGNHDSNEEDTDSVKKISSVDVSFLKESHTNDDEEEMLEEFLDQDDGSDYRIAKLGYKLLLIVFVVIAIVIFWKCCK